MRFELERDVSLASMTTLGLGGPARWFVRATTVDELEAALDWARENAVGTLILGGGSNLVVADAGYDGLAIRLELRGLRMQSDGRVGAAAGEPWDHLVEQAVSQGLAGLECLSGIPGAVGATPIQNVGAYGQEVSDVVEFVDIIELPQGTRARWTANECAFGYRDSAFKRAPGRAVVTGVHFGLRPGGEPTLRYPELARAVAAEQPTLAGTRDAVLALRRAKSMVIAADDDNRRSVGSFFTNPIVPDAAADALVDRAIQRGLVERAAQVPRYPTGAGRSKLAAAWLIERSGIHRGYRRGPVGVSSRHTLALVHHGGGTTTALLELAAHIRDVVHDAFDIQLSVEPTLVGVRLP